MSIVLTQQGTSVRRGAPPSLADTSEGKAALNRRGEAIVMDGGLPRLTEMVRLGKSYYAKGTVTTKTLSQVAPTTAAASTLWNGNSAGNDCYVLEGIGMWSDVSGAAANLVTPYIQPSIVTTAAAPATAETDIIRNLQIGKGVGDTNATVSQTVTVTDNGWLALGTFELLAANKGAGLYIPLNGLFIIPPGHHVALHAAGTAATAEFGFYYIWHEVAIDLV